MLAYIPAPWILWVLGPLVSVMLHLGHWFYTLATCEKRSRAGWAFCACSIVMRSSPSRRHCRGKRKSIVRNDLRGIGPPLRISLEVTGKLKWPIWLGYNPPIAWPILRDQCLKCEYSWIGCFSIMVRYTPNFYNYNNFNGKLRHWMFWGAKCSCCWLSQWLCGFSRLGHSVSSPDISWSFLSRLCWSNHTVEIFQYSILTLNMPKCPKLLYDMIYAKQTISILKLSVSSLWILGMQ
jgi:hypothetical protein